VVRIARVLRGGFVCTRPIGGDRPVPLGQQSVGDAVDGHCQRRGSSGPRGRLDTATAGRHTYSVTAVSRDGQRATARIIYTITKAGKVGAKVDKGDYATNQRRVQISLVWPAEATEVLIANNPEFHRARTLRRRATLSWTLPRMGRSTIPRAVYVLFVGESSAASLTRFVARADRPRPGGGHLRRRGLLETSWRRRHDAEGLPAEGNHPPGSYGRRPSRRHSALRAGPELGWLLVALAQGELKPPPQALTGRDGEAACHGPSSGSAVSARRRRTGSCARSRACPRRRTVRAATGSPSCCHPSS
jgi:hypothetical protein